jgi:protein TonB
MQTGLPAATGVIRSELAGGILGGVTGGVVSESASSGISSAVRPEAPVRVGGNIRTPQKIYDVRPRYPEKARQAGVIGIVILELTVGTDGSVTDARVLRSIPLLDDAAVEAVRQWRFEPTLLNGRPVPVKMTVTVTFP